MSNNIQSINTILGRMASMGSAPAVFYNENSYSYSTFLNFVEEWENLISKKYKIGAGKVVSVLGDFSPQICALFFALMKKKTIIVPLTHIIKSEISELRNIAKVQYQFSFTNDHNWSFEDFNQRESNGLIAKFRERELPGLVVFTSGSTGEKKGILHDCERVMKKFVDKRVGWKTILFLMMDHFGGFNTFLSAFAYEGTAVCIDERKPESVCRVIEQSRSDLLPTSPTFLNLLIASKCYSHFDLSSIKLITYGTEVMTESTLQKTREIFPDARIKQTYGLSELGVVHSKSKDDSSLMLKIGGSGFETKIIDNILWIRSSSNMIGYLNAENPIDSEGWMCTDDHVEVEGEYIKLIGRTNDLINVGGQKVFPSEIENILLQDSNIREATVFGVKHPLMGKIIHSKVSLFHDEERKDVSERLRKFCIKKLPKFKIPVKFIIEKESNQHNERFKKIRRFE